jgi:crotonobetainyl-CoA:carnitine CoA-transferase CaiB-like acyl-CoA transferase
VLLEGIKVVEMGQSLAGPWAATIMGDMGATVIKVEPPSGDAARGWGPPFIAGDSSAFHFVNRNKASVVLDVTDADDRAVFDRLIDEADVFIHNVRPGAAERLKIDAATLQACNPALVYGDIAAFGHAGPLAKRPGYEMALQAYGGIMSVTGTEDSGPVRAGPSVNDFGTGMWTALGVLAGLVRRGVSGKGCVIETSLLETAVGWMGLHTANYLTDGNLPKRMGSGHPLICPYGAYEASDHPIIIAVGSDSLFARLAGALGHPEWAEQVNYKTMPERLTHRSEVDAMVQLEIAKKPRAHWLEILSKAGVPCTPIQDLADVCEDEQVAALNILSTPADADVPLIALPLSIDGARPALHCSAPTLETARENTRRAMNAAPEVSLFDLIK